MTDLHELKQRLESILMETQKKLEHCDNEEVYLKLLSQINSITSRILMIERLLSKKQRDPKRIEKVQVEWGEKHEESS